MYACCDCSIHSLQSVQAIEALSDFNDLAVHTSSSISLPDPVDNVSVEKHLSNTLSCKRVTTATGSFIAHRYQRYRLFFDNQQWIDLNGNVEWERRAMISSFLESSARTVSQQGRNVALSLNGCTMAVGGPLNGGGVGCTWMFTRTDTGATWRQTDKLVGSGSVGEKVLQGSALSLSDDGNTVAIGAPGDNASVGATWIFKRTASGWTQVGEKLVGESYNSPPTQGFAVALSGDGCTVAVGGPNDTFSDRAWYDFSVGGATWIFKLEGGVWTQQAKVTTVISATNGQGTSVALSYDGNTLAVGAYRLLGRGHCWIYVRKDGCWTEQQHKLFEEAPEYNQKQGRSVSLSSDGDTLAVGGYSEEKRRACTWIFIRAGKRWYFDQQIVEGTYYDDKVYYGHIVKLSADGLKIAIATSSHDDRLTSAVWVYKRGEKVWYSDTQALNGTHSVEYPIEGPPMTMSGDAATIVAGLPLLEDGIGACMSFQYIRGAWNLYAAFVQAAE